MNALAMLTPLDWASLALVLVVIVLAAGRGAQRPGAGVTAPTASTDPLAAASDQRYLGPGPAALALTLLADPAAAAGLALPLDLPALSPESAPQALDPVGTALGQTPPAGAAAESPAALPLSYLLIIALLLPALLRLLR